MLAISWPDSLHGLLPFSSSGHTAARVPSLPVLPLSPHSSPFPTMNRTSVANRVTRHSANFRSVGNAKEHSDARADVSNFTSLGHFGSVSRATVSLLVFLSMGRNYTNCRKRKNILFIFSPAREDRCLNAIWKVDGYETKRLVKVKDKKGKEYLQSVSFFFV